MTAATITTATMSDHLSGDLSRPAGAGDRSGRRTRLDRAMDVAIATGVAVLVLIGFLTSYDTLRLLALNDGGFTPWLAPAVPLSFDLGIVVLSLKVLAAARAGRSAVLLRAIVVTLSVASVGANSAAATQLAATSGMSGRLLHAVPPAMFVICFESVIAAAHRHALAGQPPRARRAVVWLLAPRATWRTWRAAILAEASRPSRRDTSTPDTDTKPGHADNAGTRPATAVPTRQQPGATDRLAIARQALQTEPHLTATDLAARLERHGHRVSVRTAQRIKAHAVA